MNLSLSAGRWVAELRPEIGGVLSKLRRRGVEILRPAPADATDPLQSACFPLVPYCNRIRDGRFAWRGREVELPPNFLHERHSLHGLSWHRPWHVLEQGDAHAAMGDECDGSGLWPWPYRAGLLVALDDNGCSITLAVLNSGGEDMPVGLGLHPYFRRRPETRVGFAAKTVLLNDADSMPTGIEAPPAHFGDFAAGAALPRETIDNCYRGWAGTVSIEDDLGTISMTATGAPHLHLYAPSDASALCCEPVSHTPDALNRAPEEMIVLAPGRSAQVTMRIEAR
jgi:aldose 1-epimerase